MKWISFGPFDGLGMLEHARAIHNKTATNAGNATNKYERTTAAYRIYYYYRYKYMKKEKVQEMAQQWESIRNMNVWCICAPRLRHTIQFKHWVTFHCFSCCRCLNYYYVRTIVRVQLQHKHVHTLINCSLGLRACRQPANICESMFLLNFCFGGELSTSSSWNDGGLTTIATKSRH